MIQRFAERNILISPHPPFRSVYRRLSRDPPRPPFASRYHTASTISYSMLLAPTNCRCCLLSSMLPLMLYRRWLLSVVSVADAAVGYTYRNYCLLLCRVFACCVLACVLSDFCRVPAASYYTQKKYYHNLSVYLCSCHSDYES